MEIKICGTTTLDDARLAAEAGATMLGFIFYSLSPRHIAPPEAAAIIKALRAERGDAAPLMIGVFVDDPVEQVRAIQSEAGLDGLQLHGSEPPVEVRMLQPDAFKAVRPQTRGDAEAMAATYAPILAPHAGLPQFLLDAYHPWKMGGTGQVADWAVARLMADRFRLLLAGGLTVENVGEAIARVRPWGVDVVSGVEASKGRKDPAKLRAFVEAVRAASATLDAERAGG